MSFPATGRWIRCFRPSPDSAARLVCFPHAGGSATSYLPLSRQLAPRVETWALQYPGRQERRKEPLRTSVDVLADEIFDVLAPQLEPRSAPYAFFGHSMGAIVAFEVALRFARAGLDGPVRLFASARRAPSVPNPGSVRLRDDAGLLAEMERLGGTAPGVLDDAGLRAMVLPVVRADYQAIETYRCAPGAAVGCPVTVLCGDRDPALAVGEAAAWREHTRGGCDVAVYPGGHFYLDGQVAAVARDLTAAVCPSGEPPLRSCPTA